MDGLHLSYRIDIRDVSVGKPSIVLVAPREDILIQDPSAIMRLELAILDGLAAGNDGLSILPFQRQAKPIQRLWLWTVGEFAAEFGETFRGWSGPAEAKENRFPPIRPRPSQN